MAESVPLARASSIKIAVTMAGVMIAIGAALMVGSDSIEIVQHTRPPSSVLAMGGQTVKMSQQEGSHPQAGPSVRIRVATPAILGQILAKDSWAPMAGVTVVIEQGRKQHRCVTDTQGYYLFENLATGPAVIKVLGIEGPAIELKPDDFKWNLNFFFSPQGGLESAPVPPRGGKG
jgi:hypothetical protein